MAAISGYRCPRRLRAGQFFRCLPIPVSTQYGAAVLLFFSICMMHIAGVGIV
jgi:hypothetical protein